MDRELQGLLDRLTGADSHEVGIGVVVRPGCERCSAENPVRGWHVGVRRESLALPDR